jgi:hypothetical protein
LPARGTILPSALIRQRSFSSITTGTSRIFGFAAVGAIVARANSQQIVGRRRKAHHGLPMD